MARKTKRCSKCGRDRALSCFATTRARHCKDCIKQTRRASTKDARLQSTYGITVEEYEAVLARQGGVCAICKGKRKVLDVDHDHKLEQALGATRPSVRGLLCRRCNRRLLPACLDRVEVLEAAIEYLRRPPAREVLA